MKNSSPKKPFKNTFNMLLNNHANSSMPQIKTMPQLEEKPLSKFNKKSFQLDLPFFIGEYEAIKKIGKGSFGLIYKSRKRGFSDEINNEFYAIKIEKTIGIQNISNQIRKEIIILNKLNKTKGFTTLFENGIYNDFHYMITTLLGQNLELSLDAYKGKFDLLNTLKIGYQMIERIQNLHEIGYIHRDLKPENFLMGLNKNSNTLYLIDFGLSKQYIINKMHIPMEYNKGFIGTARFASPNAHLGIQQGRKDDLISIGYILIYFLEGHLPWQNLNIDDKKEKYEKIKELKLNIPVDKFCNGHHSVFLDYFNYINTLQFTDCPNYKLLMDMFKSVFTDLVLPKKIISSNNSIELNTKNNEDLKLNNKIYEHLKNLETEDKPKKLGSSGLILSQQGISSKNFSSIPGNSTQLPCYEVSSNEIEDEEVEINKTYVFHNKPFISKNY